MLAPTQIEKYCDYQFKLSPAATAYIEEVRLSEPSRAVGTHAEDSICSFRVSRKMGRNISVESRMPEGAFFVLCEFDENVLEFWDQPQPVKVRILNKLGRWQWVNYTPDFLVLRKSGPEVVEVKTIEQLEHLVVEQPENWKMREDGEFEYVPAVRAFAELGLRHRVFSYRTDMRFEIANYQLLMASRRSEDHPTAIALRVDMAMEEAFCWSLFDLRNRLSLPSYTPLLRLIDSGYLVADLKTSNLAEPVGCCVARRQDLLEHGVQLRKQGQIYVDDKLTATSLSVIPSQREAAEALDKLKRLREESAPERTLRRWRKQICEGVKQGLSEFQCLLPSYHLRGNAQRKISGKSEAFLEQFLLNEFANAQGLSLYRGYIQYVEAVESQALSFEPVARKTFTRHFRRIHPTIVERARHGRRGANAIKDASDPRQRGLKPTLPWQACAIDHYKADIFVVCYSERGTVFIARPWITGMIDLATGKVLAITVSLRDPSRVACSKVIRECVRRHRRLPLEVMVDRGSDFQSVFFFSLLAHYSITLSLRPASAPKYGSEIEGLFRDFLAQWLSQRPGNLNHFKEARAVDGSKVPAKSAILSPFDLYRELQAYSAWRDAKPKGIEIHSSAERFERGHDDFPFMGIRVMDDAEFQLATAVETTQYVVDYQRGLHIGDLWYSSPQIGKIRGKKAKLEVRRDPENPHVVYALIDAKWEPCFSSHIGHYAALDGAQQLQEGLIAIEGQNFRRKIKERFDVDLARLVREMDEIRENGDTPAVMIPQPEEDDLGPETLLETLDLKTLRAVKVEGW